VPGAPRYDAPESVMDDIAGVLASVQAPVPAPVQKEPQP
jgi:hypothetical protein